MLLKILVGLSGHERGGGGRGKAEPRGRPEEARVGPRERAFDGPGSILRPQMWESPNSIRALLPEARTKSVKSWIPVAATAATAATAAAVAAVAAVAAFCRISVGI